MTFAPPAAKESHPELPGAIARLAWLGGSVVTLLVPMIFLAIGYQSEIAPLKMAVRFHVQDIFKLSRMPAGSAGTEHRSPQDLIESLAWMGEKTGFRITGEGRQLLAEKNRDLSQPVISHWPTGSNSISLPKGWRTTTRWHSCTITAVT